MRIPRIVIGGTHSGAGKTTIATGIMAALKERGREVQPYKVGPDYIDPSYHAAATGKPSRNLDRWLLGEYLPRLFGGSAQGHWAVIEGVMGLFDGMSGTKGYGSTADIAKELKAPVILIIDAASMAQSVAALIHGFKTYDRDLEVAGVIFNRVKSNVHAKMLNEAARELEIAVLGCVPRDTNVRLPERHLGLVPVGEKLLEKDFLRELIKLIRENVDLDRLENIMLSARELPDSPEYKQRNGSGGIPAQSQKRIGLAWDEAFLFYYQDALELLEDYGFTLVPFSPLHDRELPSGLDGLFLGGGFPELHLPELSGNASFLESIQDFARRQKPIYAECGGYMYLGQEITDFQGNAYATAGLIPMRANMASSLQGMGYREGIFLKDCFLGKAGTRVCGHEFHYSRVQFTGTVSPAVNLYKGSSFTRSDGYLNELIFASYLHVNFAGHPELLSNWAGFYKSGELI